MTLSRHIQQANSLLLVVWVDLVSHSPWLQQIMYVMYAHDIGIDTDRSDSMANSEGPSNLVGRGVCTRNTVVV